MGYYSKNSLGLMCDQINRDNPNMGLKLTPQNVVLLKGPLTDQLGATGRNTRAVFNGVTGGGITGRVQVFYDRTDMSKLYNGITVAIELASTITTLADALPAFNARYGHGLEVADLKTPGLVINGQQGTILLEIATTSLAYKGSINIKWNRAPVGTFPNSGPGTKVMLYGSMDAGWFGIVPEAEMFNKLAFYNAINEDNSPAIGTPTASLGIFYYKFAYKGRFIFVPNVALVSNLSWSDVYKMGAAYSPTETNMFPPAAVEAVPQTRMIEVVDGAKTWQFSPRFQSASQNDPVDVVTAVAPTHGGEIWDLYRHTTTKGAHQTGLWANIDDLGVATALDHVIQTLITNNAIAHAVSANAVYVGSGDKTTYKTPLYRPVLELVNDLNILRGTKFKGTEVLGRIPSVIVNISVPDETERLLTVREVHGSLDIAASAPNINFIIDILKPLENIGWTTTERDSNLSRVLSTVQSTPVRNVAAVDWTRDDFSAPMITLVRT